jgi:two-component system, OmpR family, copper resistance phosphate regulon response regulator CusR
MRILVVEDEVKVANALREGLEIERHEVAVESTGEGGFFRMTTEAFDLMLLDITLPGRDGLHILSSLRDRGVKTPILVLTARDSVADRALGLQSGADDYIVKPFALAELMARIRALVRRGATDSIRFLVGDLSLDRLSRQVTRGEQAVRLTVREFQLLEYLMRNAGHVVSRETLARDVWQEPARTALLYNIIDVHVGRLRRKIDVDSAVKLIHTIRGVGFMLASASSGSD